LLDVSRITQDKINLNKSALDLRATVEDAVESVRSLANHCQIDVTATLPDDPVPVEGDAARLQQVQVNLLSNAIKYSPPGQRVELEILRDGASAVIRVTDSGAGITPESLDRIFDMFVQTGNTLDRAHGGMGVGLTLVRKLVDLHGGTVVARSDGLGQGSEFEVRLPIVNSFQVMPAKFEPSAVNDRGTINVERIAIIEDQEDNRKMLASLLEMGGYTVYTARSGVEGTELVQRENPEVAIIDIGLPEVDGYEVARRIRETIGNQIVLIALTGYGQSQDVEKARAAGFDHHLVKPLQMDRLVEVLNRGSKSRTQEHPRAFTD
jgi:two-component system CheB/CheR fusion protein